MYVTLTKKRIAIILSTVIISLILLGQFFTIKSGGIDVSTNQKRVDYIKNLGYFVDDSAQTVKKVKIPQIFSDVYKKYNLLQKKSGFDLSDFKGKTVEIYTYPLRNQPQMQIHLMVYENKIIGGDIASTKVDGKMTELKRKNE